MPAQKPAAPKRDPNKRLVAQLTKVEELLEAGNGGQPLSEGVAGGLEELKRSLSSGPVAGSDFKRSLDSLAETYFATGLVPSESQHEVRLSLSKATSGAISAPKPVAPAAPKKLNKEQKKTLG